MVKVIREGDYYILEGKRGGAKRIKINRSDDPMVPGAQWYGTAALNGSPFDPRLTPEEVPPKPAPLELPPLPPVDEAEVKAWEHVCGLADDVLAKLGEAIDHKLLMQVVKDLVDRRCTADDIVALYRHRADVRS